MDEAITLADHTARTSGRHPATPASTTDLSPELPKDASLRAGAAPQPQIQIVAPPPVAPVSLRPDLDSTLRGSDAPMLPARRSGMPAWLVVVIALLCIALGFAGGILVGKF
jgi:hypothetical protein